MCKTKTTFSVLTNPNDINTLRSRRGGNVQFYGRGYKNRDPWLREMEHQRATSRRRTPPQKVILIPSSTCRGTAWVNTPDPGRMRVVVRLKAVVPFASPG